MNLAHYDNFYPTFVDAGIPTLYHSKPKPKWTIYEEDCSNVVREVARNIAKIKAPTKSSDDTAYSGLMCDVKRGTKWINLATKNVVAGKSYSFSNSETYFWAMTASNAKSGSVIVSDGKIVWKAKKTTYTKSKKTVYYVKKKVKGKWRWKKVKQGRYGKS